MALGTSKTGAFTAMIPVLPMFFSTWETYHTHTLYLGYFNGPTGTFPPILARKSVSLISNRGTGPGLLGHARLWLLRSSGLETTAFGLRDLSSTTRTTQQIHASRLLGPGHRIRLLCGSPTLVHHQCGPRPTCSKPTPCPCLPRLVPNDHLYYRHMSLGLLARKHHTATQPSDALLPDPELRLRSNDHENHPCSPH